MSRVFVSSNFIGSRSLPLKGLTSTDKIFNLCTMHIRLSNLLSAFSLGFVDRQRTATEMAASLGSTAPAAIVTIGSFPGETIHSLSKILMLSHSATVRLIDRLQENNLVERNPGEDNRSVTLSLTRKGSSKFAKILEARRRTSMDVLKALEPAEQKQLEALLEKLLSTMTSGRTEANSICRLCEIDACPQDRCPVENAAQDS